MRAKLCLNFCYLLIKKCLHFTKLKRIVYSLHKKWECGNKEKTLVWDRYILFYVLHSFGCLNITFNNFCKLLCNSIDFFIISFFT